MTRQRRSLTWALALLGAAYAVSALHVLRERQPTTASGAGPVVIRFVHWQLESGMREAFDRAAHRYMALHPAVRVVQFAVPGNVYPQWLSTQLIGDDVPDLVCFNSVDPSQVAQIPRHYRPITRWVNEPNPYNRGTRLEGVPWRLTFIDGGKNRATYFNQYRNYYAVGLSAHTMRMFYNRDLLKEITGRDQPPGNFREWLALGEKVRAHRPGLIHVAGAHDNAVWLLPTMVNQALGRWMLASDHSLRFATTSFDFYGDLLEGRWSLRSPAMQASLDLMRQFGAEMTPGFLQLHRDSAMRTFLRGEALSLPNGTWDYPTMRATARFRIGAFHVPLPAEADPEFGAYALLPPSDGGFSTALPFYLTRRSRHPEVAIDFLRYLTSVEGNRLFSRDSHWMPAVEGVAIEPELEPFRQVETGYLLVDSQSAPSVLHGPGEEYAQLFETNLYRLYAPDGGVEAYTRALEGGFRTAVVHDLRKQVHVQSENLLSRDLALSAQLFLDPAERAEGLRQQSGLHLSEVQIYLMAATLARAAP